MVFSETELEKTKDQSTSQPTKFGESMMSSYKKDKPTLTEDINAPKMQVKNRKLKTISTSTIKVFDDSKKAKVNQRMFKSI